MRIQHDSLLSYQQKAEHYQWVTRVLQDTEVDDLEKRCYLADYILTGQQSNTVT
jgi:hypothetical protein